MRWILATGLILSLAACDLSKCLNCEGKGTVRCTLCSYGKQDCGVCVNGSAESGRPCTFCKGAGTVTCQACKGEGSTPCRYCKGTGRRSG